MANIMELGYLEDVYLSFFFYRKNDLQCIFLLPLANVMELSHLKDILLFFSMHFYRKNHMQ